MESLHYKYFKDKSKSIGYANFEDAKKFFQNFIESLKNEYHLIRDTPVYVQYGNEYIEYTLFERNGIPMIAVTNIEIHNDTFNMFYVPNDYELFLLKLL